MRIAALLLWLVASPAFAASEAGDGDIVRLNFADAPGFHSAIENHFAWLGAPDGAQTPSFPRVSPKVRVALWTSQSVLPANAEVLRSKPPSAIILEGSPKEQITATTVRTVLLESAPAHREKKQKQVTRRVPPRIDEEEEEPSLWQRILGALLPGE